MQNLHAEGEIVSAGRATGLIIYDAARNRQPKTCRFLRRIQSVKRNYNRYPSNRLRGYSYEYCGNTAGILSLHCKDTAKILQTPFSVIKAGLLMVTHTMFALPDISCFMSPGKVPKVKSKVLALLLPTIEQALDAGYAHAQLHAWLGENGLALDEKYYHDALYRLRKKRALAAGTAAAGVQRPASLPRSVDPSQSSSDAARDSPVHQQTKGNEKSSAVESLSHVPRINISKSGNRDSGDKFHPLNSRGFDVSNI